jgi:predicted short-subunit dehydrogenase-like oxidoreductase (DUF2520 family)
MDIAIVGSGRAGTAVAVLWRAAGHRIVAVEGREATAERAARHLPGVPVMPIGEAARAAALVVIAVPDDLIAARAQAMVDEGGVEPGRWIAHLSGATPLAALDAARARGARGIGIHPLQTFPDVDAAIERIPGCTVAIGADDEEGAFLAERLAEDLGGRPFRLAEEHRALYHAAAVFASNYLVAAAGVAEHLFEAAGLPDPLAALVPLQRASVENLARTGAGPALTGPAARGDAGTIARNLEALDASAPWAVASYVEMARVALDLAARSGRLPAQRRREIDDVLARWT